MLLEPRLTPPPDRAAAPPVNPSWPFQTALPWAAMGALLLGWWLAPHLLARYAYAPLLLSVVLMGLPHGALDHLVPGRLGWAWGRRLGPVVLFGAAYAGVAGLYLLGWHVAPLAAFWLFLACSVLHWGQGDLHHLERALGRRRTRLSAPVTILVRGGLPIVLPLLTFPEYYERLARGAAAAFGAPLPAGPLLSALAMQELGLAFVLLLTVYVADTLRCTASAAACAQELGEAALLLCVFALVPAPLAIGAYFALWHAPRHLGRLLVLREVDAAQIRLGQVWPPALRLARDLLPITLAALGLLAGLYFWSAPRLHNLEGFMALYLAFISALTLPHALVVAGMDLRPTRG